MGKILGFVAAIIFLFSFFPVFAQEKLELVYFWGDGCPHCAKEKIFLEKMEQKYPQLEIKRYEVWYNSQNQKLLKETAKKYGITQAAVPLTIIGDWHALGYQDDQSTGRQIEEKIKNILGEKPASVDPPAIEAGTTAGEVKVPFWGEVNLSKMSLPAITVVLAGLDGLNPCAMWVLIFLLLLLIGTKSRKRMWLIAGTFLLASGLVYFLILSAWLNLFLAVSFISFTRIAIGAFAIGFGAWQIKNFIQFKPGVCKVSDGNLSIQEKFKNNLKSRAEKLVFSPLTWGILAGIVVLAVGVNLVEFFCSAGIPAVYTKILAMNQLNAFSYYLYLLLYTFIFMLDDLIVFSIAIVTLNRVNLTDKYNYWATLIGGILILILGLLLIFKPGLLMFG